MKTTVILLETLVIIIGAVLWWQGWGMGPRNCPEEKTIFVERSDNFTDGHVLHASTTDATLFGFRMINRGGVSATATTTLFARVESSTFPAESVRNVRLLRGDTVIERTNSLSRQLIFLLEPDVNLGPRSNTEFRLVGDIASSTATSTLSIALTFAGVYDDSTLLPLPVYRSVNDALLSILNPEPSVQLLVVP